MVSYLENKATAHENDQNVHTIHIKLKAFNTAVHKKKNRKQSNIEKNILKQSHNKAKHQLSEGKAHLTQAHQVSWDF